MGLYLMSNGLRQGSYGVPSPIDALSDKKIIRPILSAPLSKHFCFAVDRDANVASFIPLLFSRCFPAAVGRGIRPIIVNTFNLKALFKRRQHVGDKIFDVKPSITNGNAAASVSKEAFVAAVCASGYHVIPDGIQRRSPRAVRSDDINVITPTTLGETCSDLIKTYREWSFPAKARTNSRISVTIFGLPNRKNGKSVNRFSDKMNRLFCNMRDQIKLAKQLVSHMFPMSMCGVNHITFGVKYSVV